MNQSMHEKWQQIIKEVTLNDPSSLSDKGSLVVVGSGIMCVAHFTVETLAHIQDGDRVFYLVSDPVTEVYIQEHRPDAIDLFVLYGENKDRRTTYAQITEVLLHYTRRAQKVVVVFYGHPGYLVNPSHQAVQIAKSEGLSAVELPAISSLDTMISELGFEPGIPGLQVLEATDLLLYSRKLVTDTHVVINQVGCIGDVTFHYNGFPNPHLPVLIEYLINHYGENHVVYNYIGSQFPVCKSVVEKFKLSELMKPDIGVKVQTMSTFYIPPLNKGEFNEEMAQKIGMVKESKLVTNNEEVKSEETSLKISEKNNNRSNLLPGWNISPQYKPVKATPLSQLLTKISKTSSYGFTPGDEKELSEYQLKALRTRNSDWIHFALKSEENEIMEAMMKTGSGKRDQVNSPPKTTKPCVSIGNRGDHGDQVDSAPITAKALVSFSGGHGDQVDSALITAKALVSFSGGHGDQVDSAPITTKPLVSFSGGHGDQDSAPITTPLTSVVKKQ